MKRRRVEPEDRESERLRLALARLPGHVREASRLFREITGFTAVTSFRSPSGEKCGPAMVTPPVHPLCASLLRRNPGDAPCEEEWQAHIRAGLRSHSVQRHKCSLGLRCSCVPIHYGEALVGVAKCVVGPRTASRRFARAVQLLELTVGKACQDYRVSDLSDQLETAREQASKLQQLRGGARSARNRRRSTRAKSRASTGTEAAGTLIDRALDYIARHYSEPRVSLAAVSRHLGVNDKYLTWLFTRTVGQHMRAYILQLRVQHACRLVLYTGKSTKQIASESGFTRLDAFSRAFHRYTGVTPRMYRKAFRPA